jgi:hypothetical protein
MASINIAGDTSGVVTLQAPSVAGSTTLNLPATSGTVMVNGPAFSAYRNGNQTGISSGANTKIQINTEYFDTNNNFDSTTNYRFTPALAGYYQVNGTVAGVGTNLSYLIARIFKNGVNLINGNYDNGNADDKSSVVSTIVYLNGSTDYIELYVLGIVGSGTITAVATESSQTTFSASMVRGA